MRGGLNTYAYVGGNPISLSDPLGLQATTLPGLPGVPVYIPEDFQPGTPGYNRLVDLGTQFLNDCHCALIQAQINAKVAELKRRYIQATADVHGLFSWRFIGKFSWTGHKFWYEKVQMELAERIEAAKILLCPYNPEADRWVQEPFPDVPTRWLNGVR